MYQNLKRHIQGVINASESEFNYFISKTKLVTLEKNPETLSRIRKEIN